MNLPPWDRLGASLAEGRMAAFLGPEALPVFQDTPFPASSRELADRLNAKIAVPGRVRGNLWSAAQWIETNKHRVSLVRALDSLFQARPEPNPLHRWLAGRGLPLIVDGWYDSGMADALVEAGVDFVEIQGIRRSGQFREEPWTRLYDRDGKPLDPGAPLSGVPTILYKPHGGARPASNYLVSDSDYVEVLTEIDIQTPIPEEVVLRRDSLGFLFLGCRFYDQMQRIFAKQIIKRSSGPHVAFITGELSRNEARFLEQEGILRYDVALPDVIAALS